MVWLIKSVFMVSHAWTVMRDVITVSKVSSFPFSMVSSSPFSVVSGSPFSMVTVFLVVGISPVFGVVWSFVVRIGPEVMVSLFKSMNFGGSMSERCVVEVMVTSVLCDFVAKVMVWNFMWMNDKRSSMWVNDMSFRIFVMEIFVVKSMVSFSVAMMMIKIMVLWGEMASFPVVSSAVIDNVVKAVVDISVFETVTKSMINSMISTSVRNKSGMVRLVIKAVLRKMSIVSILGMGDIMVWIHWSTMMGPWLVIQSMCGFSEVVRSVNGWSVVSHWVGLDSFFIICLCILELSSERGLIFMWRQIMMSMWLVHINFLMMNWAVHWDMMWSFVMRGFMVCLNVMWSSIDIVGWESSVMGFSMTVETWVMRDFVVWSCMV